MARRYICASVLGIKRIFQYYTITVIKYYIITCRNRNIICFIEIQSINSIVLSNCLTSDDIFHGQTNRYVSHLSFQIKYQLKYMINWLHLPLCKKGMYITFTLNSSNSKTSFSTMLTLIGNFFRLEQNCYTIWAFLVPKTCVLLPSFVMDRMFVYHMFDLNYIW